MQRVLADQQSVAVELGPKSVHRVSGRRRELLAAVRLVRTGARLQRPPGAAARRTGHVAPAVCASAVTTQSPRKLYLVLPSNYWSEKLSGLRAGARSLETAHVKLQFTNNVIDEWCLS